MSADANAAVALNFASGDDLKFQIDLLCLQIQHPDRRQRQDALQKLLDHCDPTTAGYALSHQQAGDIFATTYLSLFRCYSDRFEQCRSLAAGVLSALLGQLPANAFYAENIVPVLCRRIGQPEIVEDSEEVRLLLVHQLLAIVRKFAPAPDAPSATADDTDPLLQCYNPIMDILCKTLTDPYPIVARITCDIIEALAVVSVCGFPARADQLVSPLVAMLGHRQSPTRICAVRTIGTVALYIRSSSEVIVRCIVSVSPLLMDEQAPVRRECGRVGCRWLMSLRDRYSFFERLIPLALCGLKDDSADTRTEIGELWRRCGDLYYRENEQELGRLELVDRQPARYPAGVQRPTLGCRAIVQRSLRVCSIVCREMQDWKDDVRLHSLQLLWQLVLHSERALTAKFIEIAPVLLRHCVDEVREVSDQAMRVAGLLGMLLKYDDWIEHALAALRAAPHLGQLRCFAAMFGEAEPAERRRHLRVVCEIVGDPAICHSMSGEYQRTLIGLLGVLLDMHLEEKKAAEQPNGVNESLAALAIEGPTSVEELLYVALAKVCAMTDTDVELHASAVRLLSSLAAAGGDDDASARLHRRYLPTLLQRLNDDLDTENSELAEPIVLLHGIIKLTGFQPETLEATSDAVKLCMRHAAHAARIKILAAVSLAMLGWRRTMGDVSHTASVAALRKFIGEIVEPALVWQAGRNAEALRAMATAVLRSAGEGADAEVWEIFAQLAVHWVALVDDNNVVTRAYALGCLLRCGPLPLEPLKSTALAVLARLDDPSGEVREFAVRVLPRLRLLVVGENDEVAGYERESWQVVVKHLMATLLLHLDSPEIALRARVAEALVSIGRAHRNVADPLLDELPSTFYQKEAVDSIRSSISA